MGDPRQTDELRPHEFDALQHLLEGLAGGEVASDIGWSGERGVVEEEPSVSWETRAVSIVVPMVEARAMWARARQFDHEHGGRYESHTGALALWRSSSRQDGNLVGMLWIRWHTPMNDQAELFKIEWDPRRGGSEAEVWRALEVLTGRPLRHQT